jgi:hypothetical protein
VAFGFIFFQKKIAELLNEAPVAGRTAGRAELPATNFSSDP